MGLGKTAKVFWRCGNSPKGPGWWSRLQSTELVAKIQTALGTQTVTVVGVTGADEVIRWVGGHQLQHFDQTPV